jgi:hypothetical protein
LNVLHARRTPSVARTIDLCKPINEIHYDAHSDRRYTHKFRRRRFGWLRNLKLNGLKNQQSDMSMRRVYGFYAGQMPYGRRTCSPRRRSERSGVLWAINVTDAMQRFAIRTNVGRVSLVQGRRDTRSRRESISSCVPSELPPDSHALPW